MTDPAVVTSGELAKLDLTTRDGASPSSLPLETPGSRSGLELKRRKGIYVGAPACFALEEAIRPVCEAFGAYRGSGGCYLVGSCLERPDWRDVDVRMILDDTAFAVLFPNAGEHWENDARWLVMTVAISERLSKLTGLPIDFQFQPQTHANARHKGSRIAIGITFSEPMRSGPVLPSAEKDGKNK